MNEMEHDPIANMPSSARLEPSHSVPIGSIARSRSRYKTPRNNSMRIAQGESPHMNTDQIQRFRREAPLVHGRQPSASERMGSMQSPIKPRRESQEKVPNPTKSGAKITMRSSARHDGRHSGDTRVEKPAGVSDYRSEVGGGDASQWFLDNYKSRSRDQRSQKQSKQPKEESPPKRPSIAPQASLTRRFTDQIGGGRRKKDKEELKKTISAPFALEPAHKIVTPAFDGPISAVNAGERKVTVKYGRSSMLLPVTPSTTPLDILHLANQQSPEPVCLTTMIVVESYNQLGLERPLRKYEHVRDVMNSWDSDLQNALVITPSPTRGRDDDLEVNCVPKVRPLDTSLSMYHSQRPGHWDKRWVILRSDGQILLAKDPNGETSSICHLSDFDIYIPTARQLSKKIKPPKKLCFTVKSQQKSSIFLSTVNFVHFFSTNDKRLAAAWYRAVQGWRSWYLVNVMGEGQKCLSSAKIETADPDTRTSVDILSGIKDTGCPSTKGGGQMTISALENLPQLLPVRNRADRSLSSPKRSNRDADRGALTHGKDVHTEIPRRKTEPGPFTADSLLGTAYTQRQMAQQYKGSNQITSVDNMPVKQCASEQFSGLKRASSQRQKPRPLVDLTPLYREPPQHTRKGRGIIPSQMPARGLIEIATSPEAAVEVPPATIWRRLTPSGRENSDIGTD